MPFPGEPYLVQIGGLDLVRQQSIDLVRIEGLSPTAIFHKMIPSTTVVYNFCQSYT